MSRGFASQKLFSIFLIKNYMLATIFKNDIEKKMLNGLIIAVVVFSIFYVYFVNQSIFNINSRRLNEDKISALEGEIASLEANYMAVTNSKINIEYAHSLGFKDASNGISFVVKGNQGVNLSMKTDEI
jgi:hypothetical protein